MSFLTRLGLVSVAVLVVAVSAPAYVPAAVVFGLFVIGASYN